ncbi:calcium/sodium antiporter [Roseibium denhamense]|uniref:Cation:H+ antiporter n=1 Tax=Roseibium denhamense TaxID=76305 RepID=A0ABY1N7U6_9HYPH|nr:calcium/sodium antiporter [Roseibium denhamense]MTI06014.1 calcium/sodium antiporter [Roseibium denhamense]SMP02078.1 cation:H+ antiporter [Roseibium denhamense]
MTYLEILFGLVLLVAGGDLLVRGSVALAKRFGLSELLIGLVLVGFGTSTPELMTSIFAASNGSAGIAVGNVVGSNIANILLILGLTALVFPIRVEPAALMRDGPANGLAVVALIGLALYGTVGFSAGLALLAALSAYLILTYRMEKGTNSPSAELHQSETELMPPIPAKRNFGLVTDFALALVGLVMILAGAHFLVSGAVSLAQAAGVSDAVIGVTIVAVGTSLPELVTSVIAALKRQTDIALGNILGSNLFNILGILGLTAVVTPLTIPPEIVRFDIWVLLAATAGLLWFAMSGWRISRREGAVMLAAYVAYTGLVLKNALG